MALTECRECGGKVSTEADKCPHCKCSDPSAIVVLGNCRECEADVNPEAKVCPSCGCPNPVPKPESHKKWLLESEGKVERPLSTDAVIVKIRSGEISIETKVKEEGSEDGFKPAYYYPSFDPKIIRPGKKKLIKLDPFSKKIENRDDAIELINATSVAFLILCGAQIIIHIVVSSTPYYFLSPILLIFLALMLRISRGILPTVLLLFASIINSILIIYFVIKIYRVSPPSAFLGFFDVCLLVFISYRGYQAAKFYQNCDRDDGDLSRPKGWNPISRT